MRKLKSEHKLSLKTPLARLTIANVQPEQEHGIASCRMIIAGIAKAEAVLFEPAILEQSLVADGDVWQAVVVIE